MTTKKPQKTPKKYECKECDFITSNKKDFLKHLATDKHKNTTTTATTTIGKTSKKAN